RPTPKRCSKRPRCEASSFCPRLPDEPWRNLDSLAGSQRDSRTFSRRFSGGRLSSSRSSAMLAALLARRLFDLALLVILRGRLSVEDLAAEGVLEELGLGEAGLALHALDGEGDLAVLADLDLDELLAHGYSHFFIVSEILPSSSFFVSSRL